MRDQASKGRNVTSAATGCMEIVRSRAIGIQRVTCKDGAWREAASAFQAGLAPIACRALLLCLLWWRRPSLGTLGTMAKAATWDVCRMCLVKGTADALMRAASAMMGGRGSRAISAIRACTGPSAPRCVMHLAPVKDGESALSPTATVFVMRVGQVSFVSRMLRTFSGIQRRVHNVPGRRIAVVQGIVRATEAVLVLRFLLETPAASVRKEESESNVLLPARLQRIAHRTGGAWRRPANVMIRLQGPHAASVIMEHSQAIVSKNAHGIQRAPPWDGAWDSQDSVSVSMAPPDENAWSVQMVSSVSFVRRPAHLQRRVTEGATALGTAHVAA